MRAGLLIAICCTAWLGRAATVQVSPRLAGQDLAIGETTFTNRTGQVITISRLDWLLSEIRLRRLGGEWIEATGKTAFFSVDKQRDRFALNIPDGAYDRLSFRIGLNPKTNASDPAGFAADHPLNPVLNGLHWSWQGGYVFLAIEGRWNSAAGSGGFSYHLGNDHMRMIVERPIKLANPRNTTIRLTMPVDEFLNSVTFNDQTSSTHGRKGDPLAERLQGAITNAFRVDTTVGEAARPESKLPAQVIMNPQATPFRFTFGRHFPPPRLPLDNPLTEEGVALGRQLFHERALSVNGTQSCSSCHLADRGFVDGERAVSIGAEGVVGTRNSMPLFNLAWKEKFFWDGRAPSLRAQVLMPIQSPAEMHETLPRVVIKLSQSGFAESFRKAFGSPTINPDRIARALEQFLLTIISSDSKFDRAIRGQAELTAQERAGFQLFMTEYEPRRNLHGADCFHCHGGPLFSSNGFANNGLEAKYTDRGVAELTERDHDHGRFAIPSLRNIELTAPYMHDGRFRTLEAVVAHYSAGIKKSRSLDPNLAKHGGGIRLSQEKQAALVAFLKTLTDEKYRRLAKMK